MARKYDPNNPDHVQQRQDDAALRKAQREADWHWLLSDPRGVRVCIDLLDQFGLLAPSFVPGDALATAYNEGKRSCAIAINGGITTARQTALVEVMQGLTASNV